MLKIRKKKEQNHVAQKTQNSKTAKEIRLNKAVEMHANVEPVSSNEDESEILEIEEIVAEKVIKDSEMEAKDTEKVAKNTENVVKETKKEATIESKTENKSASSDRIEPKLTKADPKIAIYVQNLINLGFDVKKYTCFYCSTCRAFLTTTAQWEEHIGQSTHRKNVCRWRECLELYAESEVQDQSSLAQTLVDSHSDVVVGVDKVVEVRGESRLAHTWVCSLCTVVSTNTDQLLAHLSSFTHINNFMECSDPGLFRPPGRQDQVDAHIKVLNADQKRSLVEDARQWMDRQGRGRMRIYTGEKFGEWSEEQPEAEDLEEQLVMDKMEELLFDCIDQHSLPVQYDLLPSARSIGNHDFMRIKGENSRSMIGLQYLMEIWPPSRRVTPVYYCMLCDYLITNWTVHCTISKHCVAYLMKHYKSVYECVLLESSTEEEFRLALMMARDKVLTLEGRQMWIEHVVQLKNRPDDVFVPINAAIAKAIVTKSDLKVPEPKRAVNVRTNKEKINGNKSSVKNTTPQMSSSNRKSQLNGTSSKLISRVEPTAKTTTAGKMSKTNKTKEWQLRSKEKRDKRANEESLCRANADKVHRKPRSPPARLAPLAPSKPRHTPRGPPTRHTPRSPPTRHTPRSPPTRHTPRSPPTRHTPRGPPVRLAPLAPSKPRHTPRSPPTRHTPRGSPARLAPLAPSKPRHTQRSSPTRHTLCSSSSPSPRRRRRRLPSSPSPLPPARRSSSPSPPRKRHHSHRRRPHLTDRNLADLETLLASIGFRVDHRLTERDLDHLERQFGSKAIEELCTKVIGRVDHDQPRHREMDVQQQLTMLQQMNNETTTIDQANFLFNYPLQQATLSTFADPNPMVNTLPLQWAEQFQQQQYQ